MVVYIDIIYILLFVRIGGWIELVGRAVQLVKYIHWQ